MLCQINNLNISPKNFASKVIINGWTSSIYFDLKNLVLWARILYSYALKGDGDVFEVLRKTYEIGFSIISIGELLSGFKGGDKEQKNREELEIFLDSPRVVVYSVNEDTSEFYADIFNTLRKMGRPVPTNDIWIAAVAFQNGLKLFANTRINRKSD
ncbi:MAG: type II toxin-antitoxin system VapC family toxin [Deltaproteobacteria bacterium]|nr:type II toxin-antitoxin system VapC family toxin [Deltaproteobacteria bacterium]